MVRTALRHLAFQLARLAVAVAHAALRLALRLADAADLGFDAHLETAIEMPTRRTPDLAEEAEGEAADPDPDDVPEPLISERVVAEYLASEPDVIPFLRPDHDGPTKLVS